MPRPRLILLVPLFAWGCASEPPRVPVSGTVMLNGKPLAGARVIFAPDLEKGNSSPEEPRGTTDDAGVYTLAYRGTPGCQAGAYKVAVFAMIDRSGEQKSPIWIAPVRYTDVKTSGLRADVRANAPPGAYDLSLSP